MLSGSPDIAMSFHPPAAVMTPPTSANIAATVSYFFCTQYASTEMFSSAFMDAPHV